MENKAHQFLHPMGVNAKDKITGCKGRITQRVQHITGCDIYLLTPKAKKDGTLPSGKWFDEGRVKVKVDSCQIRPSDVIADDNGCEHIPTERG